MSTLAIQSLHKSFTTNNQEKKFLMALVLPWPITNLFPL